MFLEAIQVKQIPFQGLVPHPERKEGDVPFHVNRLENVPGVIAIADVAHIRENALVPDGEIDL